jgi:GNAT superfamily N-acetyltransferase
VSRFPIATRAATAADVDVLVGLCDELRQVGGRAERAVNPVLLPDVAEQLRHVIGRPHCRVVLACCGPDPAGMAVLRVIRPDPLSPSRVVQVSHVMVASGMRRRGVGHALIAAAADFATEQQIEHVAAGLYPSLRDAGRFYARLGFAPVLVQRVAPVAVVRRRLGADMVPTRHELMRRRGRVRRPVPAQRTTAAVAEPAD